MCGILGWLGEGLDSGLAQCMLDSLHHRGLVGTGMTPDNAAMAQCIATAGLAGRVRLLGPRPDVPAIMAALYVHVLSSSAEAFPNVLAEAMACGTPCVTTDVGDAARIVGDTGWVAPPRNVQALAAALQSTLAAWRDQPAWQARQQACRARIMENYGIEAMVRRYRGVWEQAAGISIMKNA